jgi:hypothetical protein
MDASVVFILLLTALYCIGRVAMLHELMGEHKNSSVFWQYKYLDYHNEERH